MACFENMYRCPSRPFPIKKTRPRIARSERNSAPAQEAGFNIFATHGRTDLGIQVKNNDRILSPLLPEAVPHPANIIPLTLNYTQQTAEFTIEAFPVRTEQNVEPGPFEGTAILKFDFN